MARIFDGVAGNNPRLNRFDLSYTNTTSMAFGLLYPVQCDECYPGDVWKMSAFCHTEVMPMVAPVMSDIQIFAHAFFVPFRIIYGIDNEDGLSIWEKFITGGKDGDYDTPLTAWVPTWSRVGFSSRTIWDQIGNPVNLTVTGTGTALDPYVSTWTPLVPPSRVPGSSGDLVHNSVYNGLDVSIAPKYAYNSIYNAFYRDENLVDEVSKDNEYLLHVAFKKDYFTSALNDQQRGTAPALPVDITGSASAKFSSAAGNELIDVGSYPKLILNGSNNELILRQWNAAESSAKDNSVTASVDLSGVSATTFTVSDLRLAFAIQRMQELSMRAGYRYTEWLSAHYNAHPTDARLDRPEYIGGAVMNVSVSPVVQSSETASTPQGTKAAVGKVDSVQKLGNYRVLEHGLIMTLVSIRPKPIYQQGINRQWLRQSRFDFYIPEEAFLSESGVYNAELYVDGTSGEGKDDDIFGYQAAWNELRCKNNMVTGAVREQFDYWTLSRKFSTRPALNQDFIEIDEKDFNKIFAVQDEDPFVVSWSNIIDCYRPIPAMGVPGLIDHVYGGF